MHYNDIHKLQGNTHMISMCLGLEIKQFHSSFVHDYHQQQQDFQCGLKTTSRAADRLKILIAINRAINNFNHD